MLCKSGEMTILDDQDPDANAFRHLATGFLEGRLSGYPILGDLIRAFSDVVGREERGVGRQNFQYGPALTEFANMAALVSPALYRLLTQHFPLPTPRHLKYVLATCRNLFSFGEHD